MALYRYIVDLTWAGSGSPGVNVFHMRTSEPTFIFEDVQVIVDALETFYQGLAQFMPASVTVSGRGDIVENFNTTPEFKDVDGWSVAGGASNPAYAPLSSAIVVGWRTNSATRAGRGRTFISPLSQGTLDTNGTPTAGTVSSMQTIANALVSTSQGSPNGALGVWSESTATFRDVVSASVRDQFAVLRSRRD